MNDHYKRFLSILAVLFAALAILPMTTLAAADITADFTDPNFLNAMRSELGLGADASIYDTDVSHLTSLKINEKGVVSLAGLEHFTALEELDCSHNQLTSLPALPSGLQFLFCSDNRLTALPALPLGVRTLYCYENQLTTLPALPSGLKDLNCGGNRLTALPALPSGLEDLNCEHNNLTALPALPSGLIRLNCGDNQLTALDVSELSALTLLKCDNNRLTGLELNSSAPYSSQLDVRNNYIGSLSDITGKTVNWDGAGNFYFAPQKTQSTDTNNETPAAPGFELVFALAAIAGLAAVYAFKKKE